MSKKKKNKFIEYEKSSKAEKRRRDRERRNDWGELSPVTRVVPNKKRKEKRKRDNYYEDWDGYDY